VRATATRTCREDRGSFRQRYPQDAPAPPHVEGGAPGDPPSTTSSTRAPRFCARRTIIRRYFTGCLGTQTWPSPSPPTASSCWEWEIRRGRRWRTSYSGASLSGDCQEGLGAAPAPPLSPQLLCETPYYLERSRGDSNPRPPPCNVRSTMSPLFAGVRKMLQNCVPTSKSIRGCSCGLVYYWCTWVSTRAESSNYHEETA
jgi:hypothetical protein